MDSKGTFSFPMANGDGMRLVVGLLVAVLLSLASYLSRGNGRVAADPAPTHGSRK